MDQPGNREQRYCHEPDDGTLAADFVPARRQYETATHDVHQDRRARIAKQQYGAVNINGTDGFAIRNRELAELHLSFP